MRVVQVNSVYGRGSTGRIVLDIHHMLIDENQSSFVFFGRKSSVDEMFVEKIDCSISILHHVIKTRITDKHGFASTLATKKLIGKLINLRPDIIHLHNVHGYYLNIDILFNFIKTNNIQIIWTLHDCWAFTGHCAYFDYVHCEKWKTMCNSCPQKSNYPKSIYIDNSLKNYLRKKKLFTNIRNLTVVTPSLWLSSLVKESFLQDYPVEVINNGVNISVFKPYKGFFREKYDLFDKYIILGVAAEWDDRKGLKFFIEMATQLSDNTLIVLVGLSKSQMRKLPDNIMGFLKTDSIDELVKIYSDADVYVNPTLEDNFPTTNLEALACGTPIVTFDSGGSAECLKHGSGIAVNKGDISALIDAISLIRKKPDFYSSETLQKFRDYYDSKKRFRQYLDLYKRKVKNEKNRTV